MKAYKVTLLILDFDRLGEENIKLELENVNFPNDCISPTVMDIQEADIGEWEDSNPLNRSSTQRAEFDRLFGQPLLKELLEFVDFVAKFNRTPEIATFSVKSKAIALLRKAGFYT